MALPRLRISTQVKRFNADTLTPVGVYLRLRDRFPGTLLLESADYRAAENSFSFLCCGQLAQIAVTRGEAQLSYGVDQVTRTGPLPKKEIAAQVGEFLQSVTVEKETGERALLNGFFGYLAYDGVQYFEDIEFKAEADTERALPDLLYSFYSYIIGFNHFKNEMFILKNSRMDAAEESQFTSLDEFYDFICRGAAAATPFALHGSETSNFDDAGHLAVIESCKRNIARGDVFQIVTSRRFSQGFRGDDFNVYRALRSINPSPYLFYFDYGDFKIFGSSPEAQIQIKDRKASIFPIAGTYPRGADRSDDAELAEALRADPKENAEHVMLVDLARNDLSKHCRDVSVETYKEVQFYSHVIHLVSKVSGRLREQAPAIEILTDSFPAGTLTGAPKYRAMQLIDGYEKGNRGYYGGAIGFLGLNGECNHAIMIRSFLSKNNRLYYQAGAGVVFDSEPAKEVAEVKNKLGALRRAIEIAAGGA